ncbi:MAG: ParB N-terminal domain-containing protein [Desulfobacterales bacterium]|nr:ParB N-terminal domain-containing protein [Desulfobacterales bacterium]
MIPTFYLEFFENLNNDFQFEHRKIQFQSIDQVPVCTKYEYQKEINYIPKTMGHIREQSVNTLQLLNVLNSDPQFHLDLHPVRYDIVKSAISRGEIDMPWMTIKENGKIELMDGRHRLVALIKAGIEECPFIMEKEHEERILNKFKS